MIIYFHNIFTSSFPNKFYITDKTLSYEKREKGIYKVSSIVNTGVHSSNNFNKEPKKLIDGNLYMFHFYNWTNKKRIIEGCNLLISIYPFDLTVNKKESKEVS